MQFINTCIFCDTPKPSKEHIFPQWLKKIINEKYPTDFQRSLITKDSYGTNLVKHYKKNTNNPILSSQTKKVCLACNNGWLSVLESKIIPIFTRLTLDEVNHLSMEDQALLSTWASILSIKWDLTDINTSAHKSDDIKYIFKNKLPPPNFRVWIGYGIDHGVQVRHRTGVLLKSQPSQKTTPNVRSTALLLGSVVLHILSHEKSSHPIIKDANKSNKRLLQIWPSDSALVLDRAKIDKHNLEHLKNTSHFFGMQNNLNHVIHMLSIFPELSSLR